jgi:hypothetical protein
MDGSLGGKWLGIGLASALTLSLGCSSDDGGKHSSATSGGSAGSAGSATTGGANMGGSGGGGASNGGGGAVHVPPVALADDASGITGLEDCALAQAGQCIKPLTRSKDEVCQRWKADRPQLAKVLQDMPGHLCDPGKTSDVAIQDALRRLNLFRWVSGVGPLTIDEGWNELARSCAIIQSYLTPDISHFPENTATCWTEQGYTTSGQSELAGGSLNPASAVDGLIFDTGDNNFHILGHRQGMLNPWLTKVGIGFALADASPATCVRMFDDTPVNLPSGIDAVYSWPSPGHQPWELIARSTYLTADALLEWSLNLSDEVDVTNTKVRLVRRKGTTWEDVPVTSGKYQDVRFHGLWINVGESRLPPGTYAIIVSGSSLPTFGYQMLLEQCEDVPLTCDVLKQECGTGIGCYDTADPFCRKSAGIAVGQPCTNWDNAECEVGATCSLDFTGAGYRCARFCDLKDPASPKACDTLCPNLYAEVYSETTLQSVGAYCLGGVGDTCSPLAPNCGAGQGCTGFDPPLCQTLGTTPVGQECSQLGGSCVAGSTCVGVQGSTKLYCQPYCDPEPTAAGPNACNTLCPNAFWMYDDFGLCIPPL